MEQPATVRVGIDLMGGDYAPSEVIKGILKWFNDNDQSSETTRIIGIGEPHHVEKIREFKSLIKVNNFQFIPAGPSISMADQPVQAVQTKQNSSIVTGLKLLAEGEIDAFASAGNTGALMVAGIQIVGKIQGVERPALPAYLPRESGRTGILIDVGANVQCRPEHLVNFARLGTIFCRTAFNYKTVRVGLLTVGEEKGKGGPIIKEAYELLHHFAKTTSLFEFVGNVEGRDLFSDKCDVIVCDGFTGNILLKALEAFAEMLLKQVNLSGSHMDEKIFKWEHYGAVPILGLRKPVLVGHGVSSQLAFYQMIKLAHSLVTHKLIERIEQQFSTQEPVSS